MTAIRLAVLSEGLCGDLRPLCYGRSTWDMPFMGRPLLCSTMAWLQRMGVREVVVLDDTPGQWLLDLCRRLDLVVTSQPPSSEPPAAPGPSGGASASSAGLAPIVHLVDARQADQPSPLAHGAERVLLLKPCALLEPDLEEIERFHDEMAASATFALVRLDPTSLPWPHIPACRLDVNGRILEVQKLRRTDTLGSTSLENILGTGAPRRSREFWAPRNLAILEPDLACRLPLGELTAPLAGMARSLACDGVSCFGRSLKGEWWAASTPSELLRANREALLQASHDLPQAEAVVSPAASVDPSVRVGLGVEVADGATLQGPAVIGSATVVEAGATVTASVLEADCRVGPGALVEQSLVGLGTALPCGFHLRNGVVGAGEVQNLTRGVPPGGVYVDGLHSVDETTVEGYWGECPLPGRSERFTSLRTLARGLENNVYAVCDGERTFVLKRRLDCNAHPLIREYHVLRSLESEGIAPRVYALDLRPEITFSPCIIMEHVHGTRVRSGGIDADLAGRIGRTCARVHGLPVATLLRDLPELAEASYPDLASYAYYIIEQYQAWQADRNGRGLGNDVLDALLTRLLDWVERTGEEQNVHWQGGTPRSLCQGDLREFNMIVRDGDPASPFHGQVALLDWERCGIDDPAYDLGWFLALARLDETTEEALRRGYGNGHAGDDTLWKRVEAFRSLDLVIWPISLIQMVQSWGEVSSGRHDRDEMAHVYEQDAYEALAEAFALVDPEASDADMVAARSAETLRGLGRLFASPG